MLYKSLGRKKSFGLWVWHKLFGGSMKKGGYILLGFGYLGGLVEIAAAGVSGEAIAERNSVFQVTYTLKRNRSEIKEKEAKEQEIEDCNFLSLQKNHLGVGLVIDVYQRGGGTIMDMSYTMMDGINNQEDKPNICDRGCSLLCKSCYKIMTILYPKLLENKAITWAEDGCKGTLNKNINWKSIIYHLPALASHVETNLTSNEINKLLKELNLITVEENSICVNFFMSCHEGDVNKAESLLGKINAIGLRDSRRASELLCVCCKKEGFIKVIRFLIEKQGAGVNYVCGEKMKTPMMVALMNKHKDVWSYIMYMVKQQGIDMTLSITIGDEQLSILDFVFQNAREKRINREYLLEMADVLLTKNRKKSDDAYTMCVNELLLNFCTLPNFFKLIKRFVEKEGGLINYKGFDNKTVVLRSLEFEHKESLVYFKYFFEQGNIDCSCVFKENGEKFSFFDLLPNYAKGENKKEVLNMTNALINKGGSQKIQKLYANRALMGACRFPNLGDYIMFLVEKLGADVHYMVNQLTPVMKALKFQHRDSWKYLMYLYRQDGVNPYLAIKEKKLEINFFDLLISCVRKHKITDKYFPFLQELYNKRKKLDNPNKITLLLSRILIATCAYPSFGDVVTFCVQQGANLNYKRKGIQRTIPMATLMSTNMLYLKQNKMYYKDIFTYLKCMLKRPGIQYDTILKDENGVPFNLLYVLVFKTVGPNKNDFMELIEILHQSNPLQKKDVKYLKNRKAFTSDNKFVLRRLEKMVGKPKKKHVPNNNKKKSKRKRKKQK